MDLKGKTVSVIGMAKTGISTANFLQKQGARVVLQDNKPEESLRGVSEQLLPGIKKLFGSSKPVSEADLIILSPGMDIQSPELKEARLKKKMIISELELASQMTSTPIIAITGTNGKSTTTTLIGEILETAGKNIRVGGNIGVPFVSLVEDAPKDYLVIEVSSFQLEGAKLFHPKISLILNITPDHLDRHSTIENYAQTKRKIAENQGTQDYLILNKDDAWVKKISEGLPAKKLYFSAQQKVDAGGFIKDESIMIHRDGRAKFICKIDNLKKSLQWQLENVLAAVTAADAMGIKTKDIEKALQSFSGLEHRLEWVRNINGVEYINDSKGTNTGAVEKSLKCMCYPVILIMGGQDKGADFSSLKSLIKEKVKLLLLIGEAKEKIKSELAGSTQCEEAGSLESAVEKAYSSAQSGDAVLLSPGCASFDMFQNFAERGTRFKEIVKKLQD